MTISKTRIRQTGKRLCPPLGAAMKRQILGEVDCEKAHAIGKQLADAATKGQHEYVLTTHIDKGHIHNHVIFCAVNFVDYHKYNSNKRSYYGIRNISDRL